MFVFLFCFHWISPQKLWRRRCHPIHKRASSPKNLRYSKFEVCQPQKLEIHIDEFNQQKRHIFSADVVGLVGNHGHELRSANLAARRALEIRAMCQGEVGDFRDVGFWPIFLSCTKLVGEILQQKSSKNWGDLFLENPLKLHLLGSEEPLVLRKMKEMVLGLYFVCGIWIWWVFQGVITFLM